MTTRTHMRSIATATAFGVVLSSATFGASATLAQAQTTTMSTPTTTAPPKLVSNIDFSKKGSITVHKRDLGESEPGEPTGNPLETPPGTALAGATFEIYAVDADLSTNAGFAAAAALTAATASFDDSDPVETGTSNETGTIVFGNLPVGVYVLRETGAPEGFSPAADSLVFIPMTNPDNTSVWNYDVHVYPKNSKNEVVKTVDDAEQNVGDDIVYTISSDIPRVIEREGESTTISKYEIYDDLDETRLGSPTVTVALSTGTAFTAGTDYIPTIDPTTLAVKIVFTDPGLGKLTEAKVDDPTVKVVTTLTSVVKAIGDKSVIVNDATTITNNGGGGGDTTTDSNEVKSYYGKLKVLKLDADDNEVELKGATFQLYLCTDQETLIGDPLTVGGATSWTTDTDGTLLINALHVTDFENGEEIEATKSYCLVETKAPDGYELLPDPIALSFTRADIASTEDGSDAVTLVAEVEDVKSVSPELPLTGGAGIALLASLGALIVGFGGWAARRLSRS